MSLLMIGPGRISYRHLQTHRAMGTFTSQIPRHVAELQGRDAVLIGECGTYTAPSGRNVDLRAKIEGAVRSTTSYPPHASLATTTVGPHMTEVEVSNETTLSAAARCWVQRGRTQLCIGNKPGRRIPERCPRPSYWPYAACRVGIRLISARISFSACQRS